jgi:hypothetical protein
MRKIKITAFWDLLIGAIICSILFTVAIFIFVVIKGNKGWNDISWYYALICSTCIAVPTTIMLSLQKISIDLSCDKMSLFYLVNFKKNDRDLHGNWIIYPSEIESIDIVRLSNEEKKKHTSARFIFSKYLKINLKYGHCKYVYVSHYSNRQIKKIIQILTQNKSTAN